MCHSGLYIMIQEQHCTTYRLRNECLTAPRSATGEISERYIGEIPALMPELMPMTNRPKMRMWYELAYLATAMQMDAISTNTLFISKAPFLPNLFESRPIEHPPSIPPTQKMATIKAHTNVASASVMAQPESTPEPSLTVSSAGTWPVAFSGQSLIQAIMRSWKGIIRSASRDLWK